MKDKNVNFDQQWIDQLSEINPPDHEIKNINPWSKPIGFIIWGFILTTLHLNILYLQYILPTIGVILIYLGFRSLRNENKYFKILWILSIFKLLFQLLYFIGLATPLNTMDFPEFLIAGIMLVFQVAMFLIFQEALRGVYKKADKTMEEYPLTWVSLWTVASFIIALSPLAQSWLIFIPMIIFYILIVRSLYSIGEQLDDTGYLLKNAPIKISNKAFGQGYFIIVLVIVISCNIFYNHLTLEGEKYTPSEITQERQMLLNKGFPKKALNYLEDENVEILKDAINIESSSKLLMFDPKRIEHREGPEGHMFITHSYEAGKKNVEVTTIYIEMPEASIYVMQYFTWQGGKPVWQDGILISGENDAHDKEIITSGLFYSKKDIEYRADFPKIICDDITTENMFGTYTARVISGALSYPFGSDHQGGYVLYHYTVQYPNKKKTDIFTTHADFVYVHSSSPLYFPYRDTEERVLNYTIMDQLQQHYTSYESVGFKRQGAGGMND